MAADGLYELLEVEHTVSEAEIKSAFRSRAKVLHPDAGGSEEEMKALNAAVEILEDTRLRAAYDWIEGERKVPAGAVG